MTDLMKLTRPEAEAKFGPLVFNNPFDVGLFVADEENPSSSRFVLAINAEDEVLALPYDYSEFDHGDWESNGLEILVDLLDAGLLPDDEYLQHVAMFVQTAVNAMQEQEATELFNPMVGIVVSRQPGLCPWDKDHVSFEVSSVGLEIQIIGIGIGAEVE